MKSGWRAAARASTCALIVSAGLAAFGGMSARAQIASVSVASLTPEQLRFESDYLFKQILLNPKNLDLSFRYAEVSTRMGDYEAAIGSLERMLFYSRDLPRVELELGLLYFRLGSYEMARSHFAKAGDAPNAPADVRQRVESFLKEIDKRISPNQYSVYGQIGVRYQSNANAGPSSATVKALGFDATLSGEFQKKADWNVFGVVSARYIYDFENQRGDTWESNLTTYYARQFKFGRLNLGLAEVDTGPRLALGSLNGWSIRPYGIANAVTLGDRSYLTTAGAGASVRYQAAWGQVETGVEYRNRAYRNSGLYPTVSDQSGRQTTAFVAANGFFESIPGLRWQGKLSSTRSTSTVAAYAYRQVGFEFILPYEFSDGWALWGRPWTLAPSIGYFDTRYDQPNFLVDPTMTRHDREWRVGAVFDMNVYQNIGIAAQVQYLRTLSSLPNYATQNWVVAIGPTIRF